MSKRDDGGLAVKTLLFDAAEDGKLNLILENQDKVEGIAHLTDEEYGWSLVHRASRFGHLKVVKWLIESGANVNAKDNTGFTPLHGAAAGYSCNLPVLALLIRHGAEIDVTNAYGQTPLAVAVQYSNLACFAYLLAKGARVDTIDDQQIDALSVAKSNYKELRGKPKFKEQRSELKIIINTLEALVLPQSAGPTDTADSRLQP